LNDWSIDLFNVTLIRVVSITGILSWLMTPYLLLHKGLAGLGEGKLCGCPRWQIQRGRKMNILDEKYLCAQQILTY